MPDGLGEIANGVKSDALTAEYVFRKYVKSLFGAGFPRPPLGSFHLISTLICNIESGATADTGIGAEAGTPLTTAPPIGRCGAKLES